MLFHRSLLLLAFSFAAHAAGPIVDLGYARYQGSVDTTTNTTIFLGVRYAAPPIDNLRWAAPQTPASVLDIIQATAQPPECFQTGFGISPANPFRSTNVKRATNADPQEDCLFLSVYTPETLPTSSANRPVVVWIHGGGYVSGSASLYDGRDLIRESGGRAVVVIIQYRLGLFGFLPGAAVKAGGALNAGLLDQEFALRWVQDHISEFGGDKTQVAIWGESAGAGSVLQQVVARNGKQNLFRAAITGSTFLPSQYNYDDEIPESLFTQVVDRSNCTSSADKLQCLRAVDVNTFQTANIDISSAGFYGTFLFIPVVDGEFIVRRPTESLAMRKINGKALLSMTNSDEGATFVNQTAASTTNATAYALNLFPLLTGAQAAKVASLYANVGSTVLQLNTIHAESIFICPTYYLLAAFAGHSYKGEFAVPPGSHGSDVGYYFPSSVAPAFNNIQFVTAFSEGFLDFAVSLNPNVKVDPTNITPQWNVYSDGHTEMLFNRTDAGEPVVKPISTADQVLQRCNFWNSIGEFTGQ